MGTDRAMGVAVTGAPSQPVLLADHTTLRLGGPARRFAEAGSEAEIIAAVAAADSRGEPLLVLGGGSNLVIADEGFPGTVLRVASHGIGRLGVAGDGARDGSGGHRGDGALQVRVAAGEDWDALVASCTADGLSGLECLSGIPGLAGATPIQNVGAYGQEVAQSVTSVRAYDRAARAVVELTAAECDFGYRMSALKRSRFAPSGGRLPGGDAAPAGGRTGGPWHATGRFVVLAVTFRLARSRLSEPVRYPELARALGIAAGERAPLPDVRAAVLGLRRGKGMVLDPADPDTRSAGSFFTNPVLSEAEFAALTRRAAAVLGPDVAVPRYPAGPGAVKVPAAWLIERAGFHQGYPGRRPVPGGPRISAKHTLALVNPGGATTASLLALAREVRDGVRHTFGAELTPEPVLAGTSLDAQAQIGA